MGVTAWNQHVDHKQNTYTNTVYKRGLQQSKYVTFIFGHNNSNENRNEGVDNPPRPHEKRLNTYKRPQNKQKQGGRGNIE